MRADCEDGSEKAASNVYLLLLFYMRALKTGSYQHLFVFLLDRRDFGFSQVRVIPGI